MYLRLVSLFITSYIMLTIGTTITTIYDVLLENNLDVSYVIPIVQGITSGLIIIYDIILLFIIRRNSRRNNARCWDFIPHRASMFIITTILFLSCIMHVILFSLSLDYTTRGVLTNDKTLLPAIYAFAIISPLCDFATYVVIYDSMANGYLSPMEESTPLV